MGWKNLDISLKLHISYFPFLHYTPNHSVHMHLGGNSHNNLWGRCDENTTVGRSQQSLGAVKVTIHRISLCGCSIVWHCWECNIREITTCHTSVLKQIIRDKITFNLHYYLSVFISVWYHSIYKHTILSTFKLFLHFLSSRSNNSMKLQLMWKVACKFFNPFHAPKSSQKFIDSVHFFSQNSECCSILSWLSVQFIYTALLTYETFHINKNMSNKSKWQIVEHFIYTHRTGSKWHTEKSQVFDLERVKNHKKTLRILLQYILCYTNTTKLCRHIIQQGVKHLEPRVYGSLE